MEASISHTSKIHRHAALPVHFANTRAEKLKLVYSLTSPPTPSTLLLATPTLLPKPMPIRTSVRRIGNGMGNLAVALDSAKQALHRGVDVAARGDERPQVGSTVAEAHIVKL